MIRSQFIVGLVNLILGLIVIMFSKKLASKRLIRHTLPRLPRGGPDPKLSIKAGPIRMGVPKFSSANELTKGKGQTVVIIVGVGLTIIGVLVLLSGLFDISIT